MVAGFGSELSLCTNSSLILVSLTPFFHDLKLHKQLIYFEIVLKIFMVFVIFCSKILARYIKIHGLPAFLALILFYMNTTGVKIRPKFRKFMIFKP